MLTKYEYPGDPVTEVLLTFGGDFRAANPNRVIVIGGGNSAPVRIPVDEIVCDTCNDLVADTDPCALTDHGLYCWTCYGRYIKPHLVNHEAKRTAQPSAAETSPDEA